MAEDDFTTIRKTNNRDRPNAQYGGKQNNKWSSGVLDKYTSVLKNGSLVQKFQKSL